MPGDTPENTDHPREQAKERKLNIWEQWRQNLDQAMNAAQKMTGDQSIEERMRIKPAETALQAHLDAAYDAAETTKEQDIAQLGAINPVALRLKRNLLTAGEKDPIKSAKIETARRLKACTTKVEGEWYLVDLKKVGGMKAEMNIGYGELLPNEDINEIEVYKNGKIFNGYRGFTDQGRPCFKDENGKYITVFTGEKFRITGNGEKNKMTNEKSDVERAIYLAKLQVTQDNLTKYTPKAREYTPRPKYNYQSHGQIDFSREEIENARPISDAEVERRLEKNNPGRNLDAKDMIGYGIQSANHFGIEWQIIKQLITDAENSTWQVDLKNPDPKATASGLGQFIKKSWKGFVRAAKAKGWKEKYGQKWGDDWDKIPGGQNNGYASLFATAWNIREGLNSLSVPNDTPVAEKAAIIYLIHHEGAGAAPYYLDFLAEMKKGGFTTTKEVKAEYLANTEKYNEILHPKQVARIGKKGIDNFLSVYFKLAKRIGANAAKSIPGEAEKAAPAAPAVAQNAPQTEPANLEKSVEFTAPREKADEWVNTWNGQATLAIGSSIGQGLYNRALSRNPNAAGMFGILGFGAAKAINNALKPNLAYLKERNPSPREIQIIGTGINDLPRNDDPNYAKVLAASIRAHENLIKLLEENFPSAKVVVAELHPYKYKSKAIAEFNQYFSSNSNYNFREISEAARGTKMHPYAQYPEMARSLGLLGDFDQS